MTSLAKRLTPAAELIGAGALTPLGLRFDKIGKEVSYDRCEALAAFLGSLRDATAWGFGDLLAYVEAVYGENEMHQVAESTGRSPDRCADYLRVSNGVASKQRHPDLSWTHHRHVAKLAPDDQSYWLQQAHDQKWTSHELRENVMASRTPTKEGGGSGGAVVAVELEKAARALVRAGNPDGNGFILVPVDKWARFCSALGEGE